MLDSPFMNACAHHFQLMTFLLGSAMETPAGLKTAEGELCRGNPNVENYDIASLRFVTDSNVPILYYTAHPLRTKDLGQDGLAVFEHGTLTWGRDKPFLMKTDSGETISYGMDGNTPMMQKLYDAVQCVKDGTAPLCGPASGLSHLCAVRMVQPLPVRDIASDHITWLEKDGDLFPCVQGLEDAFLTSAGRWALPGEIGISL